MPQLRVYRSFIKKAADTGKYLIIWDDKRRYEGQFKGFDPQGEFVILVDVKIRDENEEIESPEILIPIENIKIVSTETEEEHKKRRALKLNVSKGILMPGVSEENLGEISAPMPQEIVIETETKAGNEISKVSTSPLTVEKEEKAEELEKPLVESIKPETSKPAEEVKPIEETEPKAEEKSLATEEEDLVSVIDKEIDTTVLSPETKELIEKISQKITSAEQDSSLEPPAKEETVPQQIIKEEPVIEKIEKEVQPEVKVPGPEITPESGLKKTTEGEKVATSDTVSQALKVSQPAGEKPAKSEKPSLTTAVIEEKSKKAANAKIFKESKVKKPEIPRRKVDIGTLILDIIIVILAIVAVGILAVTLLNIKLPFF